MLNEIEFVWQKHTLLLIRKCLLFRLLTSLLLLSLASCGFGTLYGPSYYHVLGLGTGLHRVTFRGGHHPITGELCSGVLCRSLLEQGFTHFEVVDLLRLGVLWKAV